MTGVYFAKCKIFSLCIKPVISGELLYRGEDPSSFSPDPDQLKKKLRPSFAMKKKILYNRCSGTFLDENNSSKLELLDSGLNILSQMKIVLHIRCYRSDTDPAKIC